MSHSEQVTGLRLNKSSAKHCERVNPLVKLSAQQTHPGNMV